MKMNFCLLLLHFAAVLPPLLAPSGVVAQPSLSPEDRSLLILGATVISPERAFALEDAWVRIAGGRIAALGTGPSPSATDTIEASGSYLIPGLIDSHVHVNHLIGLTDEQYEDRPDLVRSYRRQLPRSYLYFGFTTLIDPDLSESTREGFRDHPVAPTLHGCGRGIRYFEGYGPAFFPESVRERIFPVWTFDDFQEARLPTGTDLAAHSPEALVAAAARGGALCVKSYHEPGFGGAFDWPVPSLALLRRIGESAHEAKLPLLLHVTGMESYEAALASGSDILAHGVWHWPGSRLDPELPPELLSLLNEVAAAGIAVQPTARVIFGEAESYSWETLSHPLLPHALPSDWLAWLGSEEGMWPARELAALFDELLPLLVSPDDLVEGSETVGAEEYILTMNERVVRMLGALDDAGVRMIFGSDTPASEGIGNPPGLNGFLELGIWAAAGIPLDRILAAATIENARAFGLDGEIGSVEVGKRADLLLLGRNPLLDIDAYDAIEWVIVGGDPIRRDELSATL